MLEENSRYQAEEDEDYQPFTGEINAENVDELWEELKNTDTHWDLIGELRSGEVETEIPSEYSRHYETKSVATKMSDGSWVGWTYWYGGGKHGNPSEIDWMEYAYDLEVTEKRKTVIVRTYKRI